MSKDQQKEVEEEEFDEVEPNTVDVINIKSERVNFELDGTRFRMKHLDVITVNKNYGMPQASRPGQDPLPSIVERLTNGRVLPVTDPRARGAVEQRDKRLAQPTK